MKKFCSRCENFKDYIYFGKNCRTTDGLQSWCKQCVTDRSRSIDGIVAKIYSGQRKNSRHRGHVMPDYTKNELEAWCFKQPLFFKLHKAWVDSGFERDLVPSVDRKEDNKPYSFKNIQLMDWISNRVKSYDSDYGCAKKPVYQYSLAGEFISDFESTREASRKTDVVVANIGSCCNGKLLSAGGFCWFFVENGKPNSSFFDNSRVGACSRKAVKQFDMEGNWIADFKSANFAASSLGLSHTSIDYCCGGKLTHAGGFIWKYKK